MAAAFDRVPPTDVNTEDELQEVSDDDVVVVEAYARAAILLDPNTIMSRIQRRLPNNAPLPSFDLESITSRTTSSFCLLFLTANNVSTSRCRINGLFVGLVQINA